MPDIQVCQATLGMTPHPGSKPVVCLPAPGPSRPAVSCNQRGHDPDDCDPRCSLYGLTRNDCGFDPPGLLQSFWARPSDDCDPPADDCGSLQVPAKAELDALAAQITADEAKFAELAAGVAALKAAGL